MNVSTYVVVTVLMSPRVTNRLDTVMKAAIQDIVMMTVGKVNVKTVC